MIKVVEFSSSKFNVLKSAGSLVVTLVTSTIMSSQSFIIGVIAEADNSSEYPATGSYVIYVCKLLNDTCNQEVTTMSLWHGNLCKLVLCSRYRAVYS